MINFKTVTLAKAKLVTWYPEKSHVLEIDLAIIDDVILVKSQDVIIWFE